MDWAESVRFGCNMQQTGARARCCIGRHCEHVTVLALLTVRVVLTYVAPVDGRVNYAKTYYCYAAPYGVFGKGLYMVRSCPVVAPPYWLPSHVS